MTFYASILANPATIDARTRERILNNANKIAAQPRHPMFKKAVALKATLDAAETLLPPTQDLVRAGTLHWDRNGTREARFRGFANETLVAIVIREAAAKYRIEVGGVAYPDTYGSVGAARAAATFEYLTTQPNQQAA